MTKVGKGQGHPYGKPYSVKGEYLVVDPPRRIVQTWTYDWDGGHSTTVAFQIEPIDGVRVIVGETKDLR